MELASDYDLFEMIAGDLAEKGWSVAEDFVAPAASRRLAIECRARWSKGEFRHAGVGIGAERQVRPEIRRDHVQWLEDDDSQPALRDYMSQLETLRLTLNRTLYLGLFEYEGHFAVYPQGAFYRRHLDRFRGAHHRIVSTILYLNQDWRPEDGGQLRLYLEQDQHLDILPMSGTLVCFLSDRFYHEVLPAGRERMSLTGWFRHRS